MMPKLRKNAHAVPFGKVHVQKQQVRARCAGLAHFLHIMKGLLTVSCDVKLVRNVGFIQRPPHQKHIAGIVFCQKNIKQGNDAFLITSGA